MVLYLEEHSFQALTGLRDFIQQAVFCQVMEFENIVSDGHSSSSLGLDGRG